MLLLHVFLILRCFHGHSFGGCTTCGWVSTTVMFDTNTFRDLIWSHSWLGCYMITKASKSWISMHLDMSSVKLRYNIGQLRFCGIFSQKIEVKVPQHSKLLVRCICHDYTSYNRVHCQWPWGWPVMVTI